MHYYRNVRKTVPLHSSTYSIQVSVYGHGQKSSFCRSWLTVNHCLFHKLTPNLSLSGSLGRQQKSIGSHHSWGKPPVCRTPCPPELESSGILLNSYSLHFTTYMIALSPNPAYPLSQSMSMNKRFQGLLSYPLSLGSTLHCTVSITFFQSLLV